jgi:hypothetical protein
MSRLYECCYKNMYISLQVINSPHGCIQLFVYSQVFSTDGNFFCTADMYLSIRAEAAATYMHVTTRDKQTITYMCLATSQIARTIDMFLSHRDKAAAKEMYLFYQR